MSEEILCSLCASNGQERDQKGRWIHFKQRVANYLLEPEIEDYPSVPVCRGCWSSNLIKKLDDDRKRVKLMGTTYSVIEIKSVAKQQLKSLTEDVIKRVSKC